MNLKQKICLWIGIVIFVIMGIFPPWIVAPTILQPKHGGYHFILSPPEVKYPECYSLNTSLLLIQWAIVAAMIGGLFITFMGKKKD